MPISILIAYRYIRETKKIKNISTMIKISFFSIFLGTFALVLAISIMNGFEKVTYEKMQNIHPQITMQSNNQFLNYDNISKILKDEFPEIASFAPSDIQFAIINENSNDISNVIAIKGINPNQENKINNIFSRITKKIDKDYDKLFENNKIIIGQKLAAQLNFDIGDKITILIPQKINSSKLNFEKTSVIISGLFKTGVDDFDNKIIFASLDFLSENFPDSGISQIGIKLKKNADEEKLIDQLKKRFKLSVYSWKELYPDLVSTLKIEKYVIFFIFLLISIVAGINIISLIYMIITYKKRDLIILKSMGLSNKNIQKIFLIIGMSITLFANLLGICFAILSALILQKIPFIKLPDTYHSTYLPIHLDIKLIILIFIIINLIGILSSWYPTRKILNKNIANQLKNEN